MRIIQVTISSFLALALLLSSACNVESFEKIRESTDVKMKYQKAMSFYEAGEYQKAQLLFEDLIGQIRGTEEAEKVYFYYAYTHYYLQNFTFGSYYFKRFHETYPNSELAEEALYMAAESSFQLAPSFRLAQESTEEAIEGYQLFINNYPLSTFVPACNDRIDLLRKRLERKAFESAVGYYRRKDYRAANWSFQSLLIEYPDSDNTERIRFLIFKSSYLYASESILTKQEERFEETISLYKQFIKKHPESQYREEADEIFASVTAKLKNIAQ